MEKTGRCPWNFYALLIFFKHSLVNFRCIGGTICLVTPHEFILWEQIFTSYERKLYFFTKLWKSRTVFLKYSLRLWITSNDYSCCRLGAERHGETSPARETCLETCYRKETNQRSEARTPRTDSSCPFVSGKFNSLEFLRKWAHDHQNNHPKGLQQNG